MDKFLTWVDEAKPVHGLTSREMLMYVASGMAKESGEFLQAAHKMYWFNLPAPGLQVELSHIFFNLAMAANALGIDLDSLADMAKAEITAKQKAWEEAQKHGLV